MMTMSFQTTVIAIAQVFAMCALGFILVRRGFLNISGLGLLSNLTVNIFFPMFSFYQLTHRLDMDKVPLWWVFPFLSLAITTVGMGVATLLAKASKSPYPNEFKAVLGIHNAGYIPLMLAMALPLGESGGTLYVYILLSLLGFDLSLWSLGVWLLTRSRNSVMSWKSLINPPLMTLVGTLILVLLGGHKMIPAPAYKPFEMFGQCAVPLAMIIIGGNLALRPLKHMNRGQMFWVCMGKLILIPLIAQVVLMVWHPDPLIALLITIQTAVPTGMTLSVIAQHHDIPHQDFINHSIFMTHVVSLVTLPFFLMLFAGRPI